MITTKNPKKVCLFFFKTILAELNLDIYLSIFELAKIVLKIRKKVKLLDSLSPFGQYILKLLTGLKSFTQL